MPWAAQHITTRVILLSRASLSIVSDALHLIYRVYNICLISISDLVPLKQNCAKEFLPDVWNMFCAMQVCKVKILRLYFIKKMT